MSQTNKVAELLRSLSTEDVISFYRVREGVGGLIDVPNVIPDDVVIPKAGLYGAYKKGLAHDVPIIFGTNRDEHKLFMFDNPEFVESKGFFFLEKILEN
jgi:carboxylesterase type B